MAGSRGARAMKRCFKRNNVSTLRKIRIESSRTLLKSERSATLYESVNQVWNVVKALIAL